MRPVTGVVHTTINNVLVVRTVFKIPNLWIFRPDVWRCRLLMVGIGCVRLVCDPVHKNLPGTSKNIGQETEVKNQSKNRHMAVFLFLENRRNYDKMSNNRDIKIHLI